MDFEIRKMSPHIPKSINSEEAEKKRYKEIKSRLGKAALLETFGNKRKLNKVNHGINKSEGALKWIADTFNEEE